MALIAANIGGGILGLPYAFYHLGLFYGIISCVIVAILSHLSTIMHLKTKDLTPRRYESVYEIAFLLMGRPSIFFVCIIMFLANMGSIIMYYIIIGDTMSSLTTQALIVPAEGKSFDQIQSELDEYPWWIQIVCSKVTMIACVGIILIAVIFKKQIEELKFVSYLFMGIVIVFICLLVTELV